MPGKRNAARTLVAVEDVAPIGEDVIGEMRARYDRLTQSQKRIAEYIVEQPEALAFSTVDQVAAALGINPSTIVRFAYRLGLAGYPDLQARIQARLKTRLTRAEQPNGGDGAASHLSGTSFGASFDHDLQNIQRTLGNLAPQDLDRVVQTLVKARRVFVCAGMSSSAVAQFFALILDRLRSDTVLVSMDMAMSTSRLSEIDKRDCIVAFTFPPYAASTLQVAKWGKENGAELIAITDTPISAVGQVADVVLLAACTGPGLQNSLVAPMAVANAILNGVTVAKGQSALDRYKRLNQVLGRWNSVILR